MNRLRTSLRRGSSSCRSLVVILAGLFHFLYLLCLFALIIKLVLMLVVPTPDRLALLITITVNRSGIRVTWLTLTLGFRGYMLLMSLYPQYLLFSVSLNVSPELLIGLGLL